MVDPSMNSKPMFTAATNTRGQTNLDFAIGLLMFSLFITATVFAPFSPLYIYAQDDTDYQLNAERTVIEIKQTQLSDGNGDISSHNLESFLEDGNMSHHIPERDRLRGNVSFEPATDRAPSNFDSPTETKSIGPSIQNTILSSSTQRIYIDGAPVEMTVTLWLDPNP
mgnify:CR=1 FL=1